MTEVIFDPKNKHHRRDYWKFLTDGTWKNCTFRFTYEPPYLSIPAMCQAKLLAFYMTKEFDSK